MLAACTTDETATAVEGAVVYPELRINVSDMTMNAETRALDPMSPDIEKYVRTMAVFEFDNEGLHEKRSTTYHFIDCVQGTVDGEPDEYLKPSEWGVVQTSLQGLAFESRTDGTVCVVANVTETQVAEFYNEYREPGQSYGRMTLDKFKTWALPFEYEQPEQGTYDETTTGHIGTMYMFGYYQGEIKPSAPEDIWIDLGRLASRIDITVVNQTGTEINRRLGYHFDNVCHSAYFFPIKMSMPPTVGVGLSRTVICSGYLDDNITVDEVEGDSKKTVPPTFKPNESHTRYFYVAAHSANSWDEATQLHLFYNRRIIDDNDDNPDDRGSFRIPLCNVHPSEAENVANGYSLSRNTRYHFTIRLKPAAASASAAQTRSVEYGDRPGEITVYVPVE